MTTSTKIKDFQIGDRFIHYGAIFEVTGETKTFKDGIVYGRECKPLLVPKGTNIYGILKGYTWMQGTIDVTYEKL